jgi:hypothetical protein
MFLIQRYQIEDLITRLNTKRTLSGFLNLVFDGTKITSSGFLNLVFEGI